MPILDGFDLIEIIREQEELKNLPVIALSGRTDVSNDVYSKRGFNANLLKPYKPGDLKKTIANLLELKYQKETPESNLKTEKLVGDNYDLSEIYEFSGQDEAAMQTILNAFLEGAGQSLKDLEQAYKNDDQDKMGKLAHRMLPMLRQMKARNIVQILMKLEERQPVKPAEFKDLKNRLNSLMADLRTETTV